MIYNLSGNVVNDAKMLMWCQTTHLYKLTVHFYHCIIAEKIYWRTVSYHLPATPTAFLCCLFLHQSNTILYCQIYFSLVFCLISLPLLCSVKREFADCLCLFVVVIVRKWAASVFNRNCLEIINDQF